MRSSDDEVEAKEELLSSFNEAKFQILRIHENWTRCNYFRRKGDFLNWRWELDCLWDEIYGKIKIRNDEQFEDDIEKIDGRIQAHKLPSNPTKEDVRQYNGKLYSLLREKQRLLKHIQEAVGLGGRMFTPDQDQIDG